MGVVTDIVATYRQPRRVMRRLLSMGKREDRALGIVLGRKGSAFAARLALFWSLLASSPLMLLNGLVGGFIGKGPALQMVGLIWLGVFMWFWLSCLSCTEGEQEP